MRLIDCEGEANVNASFPHARSDELDAARTAKEALSRQHLAQPSRRGEREAIRVLLVIRRGAVVSRTRAIAHLEGPAGHGPGAAALPLLSTDEQVQRCSRLRTAPSQCPEHRSMILALRSTARRILALEAEANDLESESERLVAQECRRTMKRVAM